MRRVSITNISIKSEDGSAKSFYFDENTCNYIQEIAMLYFLTNYLKRLGDKFELPTIYVNQNTSEYPIPCYRFNLTDVIVIVNELDKTVDGIKINGEFLQSTVVKFAYSNAVLLINNIIKDKAFRKYLIALAKCYYGIDVWKPFDIIDHKDVLFVVNRSVFVPVYNQNDKSVAYYINRFLTSNNDSQDINTIHVNVKVSNSVELRRLIDTFRWVRMNNCRIRDIDLKKYTTSDAIDMVMYTWKKAYCQQNVKTKHKVKKIKNKYTNAKDEIVEITIKFKKGSLGVYK